MTYLQVDYFLHVATTKSISKSAADLYVSAPAVSKQISLMEQELGLTLFVRGARGMELTPEGQIMFDCYRNQKSSLAAALQKARKIDSSHTNTLHIGVMSGWAIHPQIKALQQSLRSSVIPTELTAHSVFADGSNTADILAASRPHFIVDAIDCVTTKLLIAEWARDNGIPLIASMGTGNKLDPSKLQIADISKTSVCPLARVMRRELRLRGIHHLPVLFSTEDPVKVGQRTPASISFVPSVGGLLIAGYVVRELIKT